MATVAESPVKKRLSDIVGSQAVSDKPDVLQSYAGGPGSAPRGKPIATVRPRNRNEVQAIVRLANELGINLVPASSGPPRFRGGTVPCEAGVIVDLSAMDRIVRVDRLNMVAIIEPGVTFARFKAEAEKQQLRVFMPLLPRSTKSALASYLDREPITIPKYHWDMSDPMLTAEIVFGEGDLFRTGSAAGPGSLEDQWKMGLAQKNPEGPAQTSFNRVVQGAQGTLGIVTWASVKLGMLPEIKRCYFAQDDSLERLVDFSYRVHRIKLADDFLILDRMALASALAESPDEIRALAEKQAPYTLIYCVCGYWHFPEKRVAYQEKGISGIAQHYGVRLTNEVPGAGSKRMSEIIDNPSSEPYWKLRLKGGVREVFFLTTMDKTPGFIKQMETLAEERGFPVGDIGLYIQPVQQGRNCHMEFQIYYNPDDEPETARANKLFKEASRAMAGSGAFFSRPYGPWADIAYSRCPDTVWMLKEIKEMLDPNRVLNRGKLCFGEEI
jgi:FAD/FMN-containing dehydrogenase